ncbi:MAG TPA: DUF222 domain-containing protein [Acidimicrobiales bacterium]|nr:DUF222 domain-containing protein [Acidimicrobiales bacterium]
MTDTATSPVAASPVAALLVAIDALVAVDPDAVGDDDLAGAMVTLRRAQARLAAVTVGLTAAFDARRGFAGDGSRSAADWIATRTRHPRSEVAAEVRLGRRLRVMPGTTAAWGAGEIGPAHARRLSYLAAGPRTAAAFPEGEALLVRHARTLRFDDFERTCAHWRDAADPDGPEQRRGRDDDLRRVDLSAGLDGIGMLDGYLTATARAVVGGALERIERELFAADWADARARHGDAATVALLSRTGAQRRHDALVEMALRATTAPRDGRRPRPLLTVMVGYETFAGRVCELAGGTVVAPGTVAELLGDDATLIERVVFDGPNRIADVSPARSFRGVLRRVLEVRDRRCGHPTCHVPAHLCQGDHVVAWSHGGLTTQENGQLRCGPHNRWRYSHPDAAPAPGADRGAPRANAPAEQRQRRPVAGGGDGASRGSRADNAVTPVLAPAAERPRGVASDPGGAGGCTR